jgi:hypothetical protein
MQINEFRKALLQRGPAVLLLLAILLAVLVYLGTMYTPTISVTTDYGTRTISVSVGEFWVHYRF